MIASPAPQPPGRLSICEDPACTSAIDEFFLFMIHLLWAHAEMTWLIAFNGPSDHSEPHHNNLGNFLYQVVGSVRMWLRNRERATNQRVAVSVF
ncbi:unnamed protein product [Arctogadus glacialis]